MANWQRKIMLNPEWTQAQEGEISVAELAQSVVLKFKGMRPLQNNDDLNEELADILDEMDAIASDQQSTMSDFDDVMHRLYDWADTPLDDRWNGKKVCWIDTISDPTKVPA